jgi:hypothetical protein
LTFKPASARSWHACVFCGPTLPTYSPLLRLDCLRITLTPTEVVVTQALLRSFLYGWSLWVRTDLVKMMLEITGELQISEFDWGNLDRAKRKRLLLPTVVTEIKFRRLVKKVFSRTSSTPVGPRSTPRYVQTRTQQLSFLLTQVIVMSRFNPRKSDTHCMLSIHL